MDVKTKNSLNSTTASIAVGSVKFADAYTDFYLSRKAIRVSPRTLGFYAEKFLKFIGWLDAQLLTDPDKLLSGPWWKLPEIHWWHYENAIWFNSIILNDICRVRPLSPSAQSQPGVQ